MSYDTWKLRSPDDEYDAIAVADLHDGDWFDEAYYNELKAELAGCERRITCLILSQTDREIEEEYQKELRQNLEREAARPRRPSHVSR